MKLKLYEYQHFPEKSHIDSFGHETKSGGYVEKVLIDTIECDGYYNESNMVIVYKHTDLTTVTNRDVIAIIPNKYLIKIEQ